MAENKEDVTSKQLAELCIKIAESRKAEDIKSLKLTDISLVSDYFIVCTGNSLPHLSAIAEWIKRKVREKYNIRPLAIDGEAQSQWIIIDFGSVMVHILTPEAREKYQLEELWGDAEKLEELLAERLSSNI
ncbi:MAG TPA: ribosome silencing factor [Victivallales bacterium]|nr:ribosome silencing factor [Victivallales bacterium]